MKNLCIILLLIVFVSCGNEGASNKENSSSSIEVPIENDYNNLVGEEDVLEYKLILNKHFYNTDELSDINIQLENIGDIGIDLSNLNIQMRYGYLPLPVSFTRDCNSSYLDVGQTCSITLGTSIANDITSASISISTSITSGTSSFSAQVQIQYIAGTSGTPDPVVSSGSGNSNGGVTVTPVLPSISNTLRGGSHGYSDCTSATHRGGTGKVYVDDYGDALCQFRGANWDAPLRSEITEQAFPSFLNINMLFFGVVFASDDNQSDFAAYNWCPSGWQVAGMNILKAIVKEKRVIGEIDVEITDPQGQLVCKERGILGNCKQEVLFYPRLTTVYCI